MRKIEKLNNLYIEVCEEIIEEGVIEEYISEINRIINEDEDLFDYISDEINEYGIGSDGILSIMEIDDINGNKFVLTYELYLGSIIFSIKHKYRGIRSIEFDEIDEQHEIHDLVYSLTPIEIYELLSVLEEISEGLNNNEVISYIDYK